MLDEAIRLLFIIYVSEDSCIIKKSRYLLEIAKPPCRFGGLPLKHESGGSLGAIATEGAYGVNVHVGDSAGTDRDVFMVRELG